MRKGKFLGFVLAGTLALITSFAVNIAYVAAEEDWILNSDNVWDVCNFYWTSSAEAHNTIDCRNKGIKKIESNTFSEFSSRDIREIRLSDNEIETIEDWSFNWMESLFYLYLDNNEIDSLRPWMFDSLSNLVELEINNNRIRNIYDWTFWTLNKLSKLSLNNNDMISLNPWMFRWLTNLYRLLMTNNQINNIWWNTFAWLNILQSINLSSNKIENIDAYTFAWLNNAYINLKQNCLTEVPEIPWNNNIVADDQLACASNWSVDTWNTDTGSTNVIFLNWILNSGNIWEVCNFYLTSNGAAHNTIDCRNKGIKKIESNTFSEFSSKNIREIRLSDNEIDTIEDWSFNWMENLFYLYLDNNNIQSLRPWMFDSLSNLVELEINNNRIRNIYDWTFW